jgi:hypothetical protein
MEKNQTGRPEAMFVVLLAAIYAAAVLAVEMVDALWFRPDAGRAHQVLLAAAVFALTAALGTVWRSRARAARWKAALDRYAEREAARARGGRVEEGR